MFIYVVLVFTLLVAPEPGKCHPVHAHQYLFPLYIRGDAGVCVQYNEKVVEFTFTSSKVVCVAFSASPCQDNWNT